MTILLYCLGESSSNNGSDSEDDQLISHNFEVNCFETQLQPSSVEPLPANVISAMHMLPESNEHSATSIQSNEQELPEESQSFSYLSKWISAILIKLQIKYKLSDSALTALISILHLIFTIISHPLQYYFPKTIKGLSLTAGIDKVPDYKQFVVCPNPECCELYDVNAGLEAGSTPNCTKIKYNSQCKQSLFYERFLSFGKSWFMPYKTFIYLSPIVWLRNFIVMNLLSIYYLFKKAILQNVKLSTMCGMEGYGNHLE